jgi:hypothetical protein
MPLANVIQEFQNSVAQCDSLIASAHRVDQHGAFLFPTLDREQITVAAFLNIFIAWETFLERAIAELMTGQPTLGGTQPVKYVSPTTITHAKVMIVGVMKFFDFGNHEYVRKMVGIHFENGYPFEGPLTSIAADLADLRTMRNASAHISSTTQTALESLALRLFGQPQPSITVYTMITTVDPRSPGGDTVLAVYRDKLLAAAAIIAQG